MINSVYRLKEPRVIEEVFDEVSLDGKTVVRPLYMSICQADQRYYHGNRAPEVIKEKLPMALIHEAVGEVVKDYSGTFKAGDKVVLIPNVPVEEDEVISENYLESSVFRSSGIDGFMSDYVVTSSDRAIKIPDGISLKVASFIELVSVAYHSINRFKELSHSRKRTIGVWGDGNLGFITSMILKVIFPEAKIAVFGKSIEKLSYFSFADYTFNINHVPEDFAVDHGFECVGGFKAESAIGQIIDIIAPQGSIVLLGVSENKVAINTRKILEKGIVMLGSSRSGKKDFEDVIKLITENRNILNYLENLIANEVEINTIEDISDAFSIDYNSSFGKTVLKWNK